MPVGGAGVICVAKSSGRCWCGYAQGVYNGATMTEEMQTPIPTTSRSPRTILSSDKNITQELADNVKDDLIENNLKPSIAETIIEDRDAFRSEDDDIHSQRQDNHQAVDAPPKGEKRVKRHKASKSSKSARGSASKHSAKDSTTYVSKQQQQQYGVSPPKSGSSGMVTMGCYVKVQQSRYRM
ncbi:hypothetical protein Tco_1514810 [Tanacetum coccineum]